MSRVDGEAEYLTPEAKARIEIDRMLTEAGWTVTDRATANPRASLGVAVREFPLAAGHGQVDYLLFIDGRAVGVVEAKKQGTTLTGVEWQSAKYVTGVPDTVAALNRPLPFAYESTGIETRFTNGFDPEPTSRRVFSFHTPEMLAEWCNAWSENPETATLRQRVLELPELHADGLWPAQYTAIHNLEESLAHFRPRALIQMATGSGKTFTAANISYRLIKHAGARRILFLVDRANLGLQTVKEFQSFTTPDDGRKFTELYNVQHLNSNTIDPVARVTVSTIQRLYSILRGDEALDPELDERSAFDLEPSAPVEVAYNPTVPIETFDVVIVDECHRSIYGLWRQVLDYFDAFTIGLTATPGKQTFGFFDQNLVMEYDHEAAVADGVNVDFDVYEIKTEITAQGSTVDAGLVTKFRDRETRAERLEKLDTDFDYEAKDLDRTVVARDQIRTIIKTFRDKLPEIFPGRTEVPKTLIFAKSDAHADDIVEIVRQEFGKGNEFAAKITYKSGSQGQSPETLLKSFRNSYHPRIAVTVDMIATGTDVKPLECVFFMRMVKSRNYFEQMKGRGVRVINDTDLQAVTPDALGKDRFVLIDAVGITESELADSQPMERKKTASLDKLMNLAVFGDPDPDVVSSIAARLARLNTRIGQADRDALEDLAGVPLHDLTHQLVEALNPDRYHDAARAATGDAEPSDDAVTVARNQLIRDALTPIVERGEFRQKLLDVGRTVEQAIDEFSKDTVTDVGYSVDATERAKHTIESWQQFIEDNKDEITALQMLYNRPYGARDLTFAQIKELADTIGRPPHRWTPENLWTAYDTLEHSKVRGTPSSVLTNLVSLVRFALHEEDELVPYPEQVAERFAAWLRQQEQAGTVFTAEQLGWLARIRDHIATSLRITTDDFEYTPFVQHGGIGKAVQVFGDRLNTILDELNQELVA